VDRRELLGDAEPIRCGLSRTELLQLLQAGDADLEEFVEIARADAEKPQPLEERHRRIESLREHALVELEHCELAVEVVIRSLEIRGVHGGFRSRHHLTDAAERR
jgi:hypothetical protein